MKPRLQKHMLSFQPYFIEQIILHSDVRQQRNFYLLFVFMSLEIIFCLDGLVSQR